MLLISPRYESSLKNAASSSACTPLKREDINANGSFAAYLIESGMIDEAEQEAGEVKEDE